MDTFSLLAQELPKGFASALVLNGGMMGLAYLIVWKLFQKRFAIHRIQKTPRVDAKQIRFELKNAVFTLLVGTFLSAFIMFMTLKGHTKIYTEAGESELLIGAITLIGLWLLDDAWFYFVHRTLHHPKIFKAVHLVHHKSIDVNPFSSMSFHFLEPILLSAWIIPVAFLVPVYAPVLGLMQIIGMLENVKSHLGYEFYPRWWNRNPLRYFTSSTYHNLHHTNSGGNYGLHFRIWDKLLGTEHTHYEATYDEVHQRRTHQRA